MVNFDRFEIWLQRQLRDEDHRWLPEELEDFRECLSLIQKWFWMNNRDENLLFKNMPRSQYDLMEMVLVDIRQRVDTSYNLLQPGGIKVGMPKLPMSQVLEWRKWLDDAGITEQYVQAYYQRRCGHYG